MVCCKRLLCCYATLCRAAAILLCRRGFASSRSSAAAAAQAQVSGDVSAVVAEVDALLSRGGAGPKDIADAAMALAYLQARNDRRYEQHEGLQSSSSSGSGSCSGSSSQCASRSGHPIDDPAVNRCSRTTVTAQLLLQRHAVLFQGLTDDVSGALRGAV